MSHNRFAALRLLEPAVEPAAWVRLARALARREAKETAVSRFAHEFFDLCTGTTPELRLRAEFSSSECDAIQLWRVPIDQKDWPVAPSCHARPHWEWTRAMLADHMRCSRDIGRLFYLGQLNVLVRNRFPGRRSVEFLRKWAHDDA